MYLEVLTLPCQPCGLQLEVWGGGTGGIWGLVRAGCGGCSRRRSGDLVILAGASGWLDGEGVDPSRGFGEEKNRLEHITFAHFASTQFTHSFSFLFFF